MEKTITWMNPFPTMESLQMAQKKHSLCQANVSKATNLVLPRPPLPKRRFFIRTFGGKKSSRLRDNFIYLSDDWIRSSRCRTCCLALVHSEQSLFNNTHNITVNTEISILFDPEKDETLP